MRSPRAVIMALILGLAALSPAAAATWTETYPDDLSRYSLQSIEFEGNLRVPEEDLRDVMNSSTAGLLRFRPLNVERIDGDVIRIRNHLRRLGYWNASVARKLLFNVEDRNVRAIFTIAPGPARQVGEIRVSGNLSFSEEEILGWTVSRTGDAFDLNRTDADRTAIERTYANRGFYQVQVIADIQPSPEETDPIVHDLVFRISEGTRFIVGALHVRGNAVTRQDIILREVTLRPGDVMSRDAVAESRSRLYGTGYFSTVELLPQDPDATAGTVDVLVRVVERKMRFVGAGVGYGTRDQLRLSADWGHRNLWGRGKRATIRGILATELFPVDVVRARLEGFYVEPWVFGTRTQGTLEAFYERSREFFAVGTLEGEYDLDLVGLGVNLNRRLTRTTRSWVSLNNEWADLDPGSVPPPDDAAPDITRTVALTLERDRRDDFFNPRKGFLNRIYGEVSGGLLGGDNDFWKSFVGSSWLRDARPFILAARVRVGYERPFGQSDAIPDRERFKLGGATSVRGYREQEIGPGDFLILANVETRFPLFWILDGGLFADGGNAWESPRDLTLSDFGLRKPALEDPAEAAETEFRYSVGAGLRLETPVGPVRLDYGHKIKLLPTAPGDSPEDRWRLHLSLGHVF